MKENKAPKAKGKNIKEEKRKTNNKANKKAKKILFKDDTSSSDESVNHHNIYYDDSSSDYVDEGSNMCMICCESGKSNELWYRCRACSKWAHAQCSGSDSAKDYVCDFCVRH